MTERRVDLHLHTTASDGSLLPVELVHRAQAEGLAAIAITDHDSTESLDDGIREAAQLDLEFIPGLELSTDVEEDEVHILGYLIDYRQQKLQDVLAAMRESRRGRAHKMIEKLTALGMPLDWEMVAAFAGEGTVGRPHVAKAMVEKGYVPDVRTAFDLYIGRNGPAYVDRYKITPDEAIRLIRSVDGLAVLAHPLIGLKSLELLPSLVAAGLAGIETYYTGFSAEQIAMLEDLAKKHRLVCTGGSDFHGEGVVAEAVLGVPDVPYRVVTQLRQRHAQEKVG